MRGTERIAMARRGSSWLLGLSLLLWTAPAQAGSDLFIAALTPQSGVLSLGSGRATLLLAAEERTAVLRQTWSNLGSTLTGAHIHAPDGQIIFGASGAPEMFDPLYATDGETFRVARQIYDGLVTFAPGTADVAPALAESWEQSADGLTWTFKLVDGQVAALSYAGDTGIAGADGAICAPIVRTCVQQAQTRPTSGQAVAERR